MSISKMRKLLIIAPDDAADSVIKKVISLRCIGIADLSQKEGYDLLDKKNYDTDIAAQEGKLEKIERVIAAISKHSRSKIRSGEAKKKGDRYEFASSVEYEEAWSIVNKAYSAITEPEASGSGEAIFEALACDIYKIHTLYGVEKINLEVLKIKEKAAYSDTCTFVLGWIPQKAQEKVEAALSELLCAYEITEPEDDDEPPARVSGNPITKCFEWIASGFGKPKYFSFDPTVIMSVFFFVAFGLMLHDVGYGSILMIVGFAGAPIVTNNSKSKSFFMMLGICGVSSIVFGALLGGWFGNMPSALMQNILGLQVTNEAMSLFDGVWFKASRNPISYLILCLGLGAVQILTRMIIEFVLLCREGKATEAIFEILPWWIIFAGIAAAFTVNLVVGLVTVGVGALVIIAFYGREKKNFWARIGKGFVGLGNIARYIAELANYLKIFVIGISIGIMTYYVNLLGTLMGGTAFGYVFFAIISVLGHLLCMCLAVFSAAVLSKSIQKEFSAPFCVRDGEEFTPVAACEKYTPDNMEMEAV